jgi:hypothetical protein
VCHFQRDFLLGDISFEAESFYASKRAKMPESKNITHVDENVLPSDDNG